MACWHEFRCPNLISRFMHFHYLITKASDLRRLSAESFQRGLSKKNHFLTVMQQPGFFQKLLTPELVLEHVGYISATHNSWGKAESLLKLLDRFRESLILSNLPPDAAWLPAENGVLCRQCKSVCLRSGSFN